MVEFMLAAELYSYLLVSVAKHLEYANTMFSFIWWVVGFYWVTTGGESLIRDSPQIYWFVLTISLIMVSSNVFCACSFVTYAYVFLAGFVLHF